jgi:hypothetical protein
MKALRLLCSVVLVSAIGCAPQAPEDFEQEGEDSQSALIQGPDTAVTEAEGDESTVSVVAGNLKLTMQPTWQPVVRDGQNYFRITGSASRNLDNVFSFVFDDAFGEAHLLTKRKFEVLIPESGSEMNTILAGGALYLQLNPTTGGINYTGRLVTGPALTDFEGTSALAVERLIDPVYVEDGVTNLRYRGRASTKAVYSSLAVAADAGFDPLVQKRSPKSYSFDWTFSEVRAIAHDPGLTFTLSKPNVSRVKEGSLEVALRTVSLTKLDPYDTWGARECEPEVLSCMQALPAGSTDFGDCGVYYQVQICKILNPE